MNVSNPSVVLPTKGNTGRQAHHGPARPIGFDSIQQLIRTSSDIIL
jgi:hypothetical protein